MHIGMIERRAYDVSGLKAELEAAPELWNDLPIRTNFENSPHRESDDIWVRYNPRNKVYTESGVSYEGIAGEHDPVWWDCIEKIPSAKNICESVSERFNRKLMGVFITRIPPGKQIYPHKDWGWHATTTDKYVVQIKGDHKQAFCFEDEELRANDGDLYWFFNQSTHWVKNESDRERISLIMALRRETCPVG